jgi:hypothetical protein
MSFVPPKFGDLGKAVKDLLEDDFDYDNEVVVKRKTKNGLKIDSTTTAKDSKLAGALKVVYKHADFGEVEVKTATNSNNNLKWKPAGLPAGFKATVKQAFVNGITLKKGSVGVDYSQENLAVSVESTYTAKSGEKASKTAVKASAVLGEDGVSLGAVMDLNLDDKFQSTGVDFNMAFQISEDDFSFGLATETQDDKSVGLKAKFHQVVSSSHQRALLYSSPDNVLTLVAQHDLDDVTSLKVAISTQGVIQTALKHTLSDPRAKLNLATEFETTNGFQLTAKKFGLGVTLGDF